MTEITNHDSNPNQMKDFLKKNGHEVELNEETLTYVDSVFSKEEEKKLNLELPPFEDALEAFCALNPKNPDKAREVGTITLTKMYNFLQAPFIFDTIADNQRRSFRVSLSEEDQAWYESNRLRTNIFMPMVQALEEIANMYMEQFNQNPEDMEMLDLVELFTQLANVDPEINNSMVPVEKAMELGYFGEMPKAQRELRQKQAITVLNRSKMVNWAGKIPQQVIEALEADYESGAFELDPVALIQDAVEGGMNPGSARSLLYEMQHVQMPKYPTLSTEEKFKLVRLYSLALTSALQVMATGRIPEANYQALFGQQDLSVAAD